MTITALLGPTNTGKTHHAIERMLEHSSGMIGLPLRLLAREVYDRISARVGEGRVALITGEEVRVPPSRRPSYWVATVEAMPLDREVDFLAIDEIQLAAHAQRGHVFTSRLLSARGRVETWFLGSDTMRSALRELVPTAKPALHPRLSRLSYAGVTPLARLPSRSAVVAFSMPHVYELADRLRKRRGGAAVVLGALSPRTRNAQVAMFQAGEVDCLVATDAIGMGLNLDVEHVVFAATRKFDGQTARDVEDAELGQIAGRAGRWIHDGTFGTLAPLELSSSSVRAIENHSFTPVRRVQWRCAEEDLDFTSIAHLKASLATPPTRGILRHASQAEDAAILSLLAPRDEVKKRCAAAATAPESVRLLWDVCTVPDFRKLMLEVHVDFLEELFIELVDRGRVRNDWIERRVQELEHSRRSSSSSSHEDVEDLIARIAAVRTWTYVSNRGSTWLESPEPWQERTRALEDRLSDALHDRLVLRFVDAKQKRKGGTTRRAHPAPASSSSSLMLETTDENLATDPNHPFAKLASFRAGLSGGSQARSSPGTPAWVEDLIAAPHADLTLKADGMISFRDQNVGRLLRGGSVALPDVGVEDDSQLGAGAKSRLARRLLAFARDVVSDLTGGIASLASTSASAPLRGMVHRLEQSLGTVLAANLEDVLAILANADRELLAREHGLCFGAGVVYLPRGLTPAAIVARVALASVWFRTGRILTAPSGGAVSLSPRKGIDREAYTTIGFPVVGPRAIRADVLDRVVERLRSSPTNGGDDDEEEAMLASWIGAPKNELRKVLGAARRTKRSRAAAEGSTDK
jgi:ATP-dependent RNA helicase SUPV3L1/SUV3